MKNHKNLTSFIVSNTLKTIIFLLFSLRKIDLQRIINRFVSTIQMLILFYISIW